MSTTIREIERPTKTPPPRAPGERRREYSYARAILGAIARLNEQATAEYDFELEISDKLERAFPHVTKHGGVFVPTHERAGLDTKTAGAGQELVFVAPGPFAVSLAGFSAVRRAGATFLPGLSASLLLPGFDTGLNAIFLPENAGAPVPESNVSTRGVALTPGSLVATTSFSRQLLALGTPQVDQMLVNDIAAVNAAAVDHAALWGTATGLRGLFSGGLPAPPVVAVGGALGYVAVCDIEKTLGDNNGELGDLAWITTPGVRSKARQTAKAATVGQPIWTDDNTVAGHAAIATPHAYDTGLPTGNHGLALGYWPELFIGEFGAVEIVVDPYRLKKQGLIELTSFYLAGWAYRTLKCFCVGSGTTVGP
jgi:hypothetical protein